VTPEALSDLVGFAVSADTIRSLERQVALTAKWTQRINLVSRSTEQQIWQRHIADSAQLWPHVPESAQLFADLGSGAGFPGLVLAILAHQKRPGTRHLLVESDQRKAAFLREAARETGAPVQVVCSRIEQVQAIGADVVTARALAALPKLHALAAPHFAPGGVAILPKGAGYLAEVQQARTDWRFDLAEFPSQTDPGARLLRLTGIAGKSGLDT
jgi:16S rRNA (guanine527-N7)-methyltransferase